MFDRVKYKEFAKKQLKGRWLIPVVMTLITGIIISALTIPEIPNNVEAFLESTENSTSYYNDFEYISENSPSSFLAIIKTLITAVLLIAQLSVYLLMSRSAEPVKLANFIEGFANWFRGILALLWQTLWIFLWSLLFIIPGIVKGFAYSQTFFLVAEFPKLSIRKAMKISMIITNGHKGDLFVMCLSFIGWEILSCFTFGIGKLWLTPYETLSFTNAYRGMLKDALTSGKITSEDLVG